MLCLKEKIEDFNGNEKIEDFNGNVKTGRHSNNAILLYLGPLRCIEGKVDLLDFHVRYC
jgi:hypothetical protein